MIEATTVLVKYFSSKNKYLVIKKYNLIYIKRILQKTTPQNYYVTY